MHNKAMELGKAIMEKACACGFDNLSSQDWDDFKDSMEVVEKAVKADYYYHIVEAMKKAEEEDEAEEAYMLKRFKEEYGDDEGERRYYDDYRYKSSGRFAPRGKGTRYSRRGYEEYPMMFPEVYNPMEYYRDMDRMSGKMYYSGEGQTSMSGRSANMSNMDGMRDGREGRSGMRRRTYMETKELHKGNTAEDKQQKMKELERYMGELSGDITEMIADASPEERSLLKTKLQTLAAKV